MKILKLKFKNLNSLENENTINFEEAPFSEAGVFAITGPNGAGKSTILDAITLGLYGETFRFDRPASHVMTKHSAECFAEIEFSLGKDKYRSSWHAQRVAGHPEGELMPAEMKLARLNGSVEMLAETPQQVRSKITDITGMNFRSFTRSILLAQGDFAAFLNALDSERLDILEKIISTDIYADFQKEITVKVDKAEEMLSHLKQDLSLIPLLDPVKQEACEHDFNDFQDQYAELQIQQNALKQQQSQLARIAAIESQINEQEAALRKIKLEAETEQKKLDKLDAGQVALNFKDDLDSIGSNNLAVQQNKETLSAFKNELKQIQDRLAAVETSQDLTTTNPANLSFSEQQQTIANTRTQVNVLNSNRHSALQLSQSLGLQSREKTSVLATVKEWLEAHTADQTLENSFPDITRLKELQQQLSDLTAKQKTYIKWSTKATSAQKNNKGSIQNKQKKCDLLSNDLTKEESSLEKLTQGQALDDIEELQKEQQERLASVSQLIKLAEAHQKLRGSSGFLGIFKSNDKPDMDAGALRLDLERLRQDIKRDENIFLALEDVVYGQTIRNKMALDRHHLVDGRPCPLCGALQHPYEKNPPSLANSQLALNDQQTKIKKLKSLAETTERNIVIAEKQAEVRQAKQLKMQQIASQWLTLCNRLNAVSPDLEISNIKLMKQLLKAENVELSNVSSLASKIRSKQKNIGKLTALISQATASVEQFQSTSQKMDSEWQQRLEEHQANEAAFALCRQEEQELSAKILEQLTLLGEAMPAKGKENELIERLSARKQEYQSYVNRQKALTEELAGLKKNESSCQAEIKDCEEKLQMYSGQLESEETTGLHLALIEKQKLIREKEQLVAEQEIEARRLQAQLTEKTQGLGAEFSSLSQIAALLDLLQSRPELQQRKTELDQQIQQKQAVLEKIQSQLEAERSQGIEESSLEEINVQLRSITEKMDIAHQEALRLDNLLKDQERLKQKHDVILLKLQEQEQIAKQCLEDKALLSADNGIAFRRRVQNQIAEKLLSQTNAILEKISGRYYIRRAAGEQGLALEIEDTFQANARRLPKTLSGGESFIVSLALALGLSELVNNGKSVDSLFLDEGFGNLDAETLYTVISTLESLQTHGKTVGVISHVEAVQKRIKAQLQVVKKPNGMGMLMKAS